MGEGRLGPTHRDGYDGGRVSAGDRNESPAAIQLSVHHRSGTQHDDCGRCDALSESHGSVVRELLMVSHRSDSWRVLGVPVAPQFLHSVRIGRRTCAHDRRFWHG
jgi:hypothetical protein